MIYPALRNRLLGDTTIASIVSNRVYPVQLPQGASTPAITITPVSGYTASILLRPSPLQWTRFQVDCWQQQASGFSAYEQAEILGYLVRRRLDAFAGDLLDPMTSPDLPVRVWIHFADERVTFEGDVSGGWYRHLGEYEMWSRARLQ